MHRWPLLLLAACYAPSAPANAPCSADGSCPTGQRCGIAGTCVTGEDPGPIDAALVPDGPDGPGGPDAPDARRPVDAPPLDAVPLDTDGDGVPDAVDNCPLVANANQDNEDGDRFGDACDPCPPVADDQPLDSDGDGVADACDPRPTIRGDRIVLFEGFHHGIPNTWATLGSWAASGDSAIVTAGNQSNNLTVARDLALPYTVSAGVTPTQIATTGTVTFGTMVQYNTTPAGGVGCQVLLSSMVLTLVDLASLATHGGQGPPGFVPGMAYTLGVGRSATAYTCSLSGSGNYTTSFTPSGTPGNRIGVNSIGVSAAVHWVMAIDASGSP